MKPKAVRFYEFKEAIPYTATQLELLLNIHLETREARDCMDREIMFAGFLRNIHGKFATVIDHFVFVQIRKNEKVLSDKAIWEAIEKRKKEIEADTGEEIHGEKYWALRAAVEDDMVQKAATESRVVTGWFDLTNGVFAVASKSNSICDDFTSMVRRVLGSLPIVKYPDLNQSTLKNWIQNGQTYDPHLRLSDRVAFREKDRSITMRGVELDMPGVVDISRLAAPTALRLMHRDDERERLEFTLTKDMVFNSVDYPGFEDMQQEEFNKAEEKGQQYDSNWGTFLYCFTELEAARQLVCKSLMGEIRQIPMDMDKKWTITGPEPKKPEPTQQAPGEPDPILLDAMRSVLKMGVPSISSLQRDLKVGYNRAARLIEFMEWQGWVTPMQADGWRKLNTEAMEEGLKNITKRD